MQNSLFLKAHETSCDCSSSNEQHSVCSISVELKPGMVSRETDEAKDNSCPSAEESPEFKLVSVRSVKLHGLSKVRSGQT